MATWTDFPSRFDKSTVQPQEMKEGRYALFVMVIAWNVLDS
jgi:hypothetical protein